jgi:hypothetical protein
MADRFPHADEEFSAFVNPLWDSQRVVEWSASLFEGGIARGTLSGAFRREDCREERGVLVGELAVETSGGRQRMLVEEKKRAARENAVVVAKGVSLSALAVHRSAVLGIQVLDKEAVALAPDCEVEAGEGVVQDGHVGAVATANGDWLFANLPSLSYHSVFTQQTQAGHTID